MAQMTVTVLPRLARPLIHSLAHAPTLLWPCQRLLLLGPQRLKVAMRWPTRRPKYDKQEGEAKRHSPVNGARARALEV